MHGTGTSVVRTVDGEHEALLSASTGAGALVRGWLASVAPGEPAPLFAAAAAALPDLGDALLAREAEVAELAQRYRFAQRLLTTARGYSYPTAREASLKLMETSYVSAQAFSGADLLHGPLALVDPQVPVLAVVADGVGGAAMEDVLPRLAERNADVCCVGHPGAVSRAAVGFALPGGAPEELSPLLEIVPFQLLALHLAVARGGDPDAPRGLSKITETL